MQFEFFVSDYSKSHYRVHKKSSFFFRSTFSLFYIFVNKLTFLTIFTHC